MVKGRDFDSGDRAGSQNVMTIDAALADHFFPGQDPIGKQIVYLDKKSAWTIVGVVQNSRHNAVDHGLARTTARAMDQDEDLKSLHGDPHFQALVSKAKNLQSAANVH